MNTIPSHEINSIERLLELVDANYPPDSVPYFRGHRDETWPLVPRIARLPLSLAWSHSPASVERHLLEDFVRESAPYIQGELTADPWDALTIGQHHGLPTRLLDWSTNPLVALWFAVEAPPATNRDAAVWALNTEQMPMLPKDHADPFVNNAFTCRLVPRHLTNRVVAQSGTFTVHRANDDETFSPMQNVGGLNLRLRKFLVPKYHFPSLRRALTRCGITRASLFPELPSVCQRIVERYVSLADEGRFDAEVNL